MHTNVYKIVSKIMVHLSYVLCKIYVYYRDTSIYFVYISQELDHFPAPIILVGNKNDLWHQRQVVTDLACQVYIFYIYMGGHYISSMSCISIYIRQNVLDLACQVYILIFGRSV